METSIHMGSGVSVEKGTQSSFSAASVEGRIRFQGFRRSMFQSASEQYIHINKCIYIYTCVCNSLNEYIYIYIDPHPKMSWSLGFSAWGP